MKSNSRTKREHAPLLAEQPRQARGMSFAPPDEAQPADRQGALVSWRPLHLRWVALAVALALVLVWWAANRPTRSTGNHVAKFSSISFSPVGDAYVSYVRPSVHLGTVPVLRTASRPKIRSYLTFSVAGLPGIVTRATLRLWSNVADVRGLAVHAVGGLWNEDSITAANAPAIGDAVDQTGRVAAKAWITADVTQLVSGDGLVSMALTQVGSGSGQYDSREGAHQPELAVQTSTRALLAASPAATLRSAIENVPEATARRYAAHDDRGHSMDTLKIISSPSGGYLGVYHSGPQGSFRVYLAESRDLLHWVYKAQLDSGASQPTIAALSDSGFLLADEASGNRTAKLRPRLRFRHYASLAALLSGRPDRTFEAPHTLAPTGAGAEGTPNIFSAALSPDLAHSRIEVGFHYRLPHGQDRPGRGTLTRFSSWSAWPDTHLEAALHAQGVHGKIGDRDGVTFLGGDFDLIEAQAGAGPSWQVYLYDESTHDAAALHIRTDQGSGSFGNPTVTNLRGPSGRSVLVVTLFLRQSLARSSEAGELVYFRAYSARHAAGTRP